jgi:hypothetical protein
MPGSIQPIQLVQNMAAQVFSTGGGVGSALFALPKASLSGTLLILLITTTTPATPMTVTSITDDGLNTWLLAARATNAASATTNEIWYVSASARAAQATINVSDSVSSSSVIVSGYEVKGITHASNVLDRTATSATNTSNTTAISGTASNTRKAKEFIPGLLGWGSDTIGITIITTTFTSEAVATSSLAGAKASHAHGYRITRGTGDFNYRGTLSSAIANKGGCVATFRAQPTALVVMKVGHQVTRSAWNP